jgi:hypothetical protein
MQSTIPNIRVPSEIEEPIKSYTDLMKEGFHGYDFCDCAVPGADRHACSRQIPQGTRARSLRCCRRSPSTLAHLDLAQEIQHDSVQGHHETRDPQSLFG